MESRHVMRKGAASCDPWLRSGLQAKTNTRLCCFLQSVLQWSAEKGTAGDSAPGKYAGVCDIIQCCCFQIDKSDQVFVALMRFFAFNLFLFKSSEHTSLCFNRDEKYISWMFELEHLYFLQNNLVVCETWFNLILFYIKPLRLYLYF